NWHALRDSLTPSRSSYSQYGEDEFVAAMLSEVDPAKGFYIDVGANHPTRISNTYLFYRRGWSGIAIDPQRQMEKLFRACRPRDQFIRAGCGRRADIAEFSYAGASVLSGF